MSRLYLCEKPSQARDIARVLGASRRQEGCLAGDGITVTWCFGHLLEMVPPDAYDPALKRWSLEQLPIIPAHWRVAPRKDARKQLAVVKRLLGQAASVVVATFSTVARFSGGAAPDAGSWRTTAPSGANVTQESAFAIAPLSSTTTVRRVTNARHGLAIQYMMKSSLFSPRMRSGRAQRSAPPVTRDREQRVGTFPDTQVRAHVTPAHRRSRWRP